MIITTKLAFDFGSRYHVNRKNKYKKIRSYLLFLSGITILFHCENVPKKP